MNRISKALLIFVLTFCIVIKSYGQARLGSSATKIKNEFAAEQYQLKEGFDKDGDYYIDINGSDAKVRYYFDAGKICTSTAIIPTDQDALKKFVEVYNKKFVVISSTEWKMYSDGGVMSIQLFLTDGKSCFVCVEAK